MQNEGQQQNLIPSNENTSQTTTVIIKQPIQHKLGRYPIRTTCPKCQQTNTTKTEYVEGNQVMLCSIILCLLGGCLCALIPCCIDDCKDVHHKCPVCNHEIGISKA